MDFLEAVVDALDAGIVIRPACCDDVDRRTARCRRTHEAKELGLAGSRKPQVGKKEMLIEITRGHCVFRVVLVQKQLPLVDFQRAGRARCRQSCLFGRARPRSALFQPDHERVVIRVGKRRETEGHSAPGVFAQESADFACVLRAGQVARLGMVATLRHGIPALGLEEVRHDRLVLEPFARVLCNAVKTHLPPLVCRLCVDKKPRRCLVFQAVRGVDGILAATAVYPLI